MQTKLERTGNKATKHIGSFSLLWRFLCSSVLPCTQNPYMYVLPSNTTFMRHIDLWFRVKSTVLYFGGQISFIVTVQKVPTFGLIFQAKYVYFIFGRYGATSPCGQFNWPWVPLDMQEAPVLPSRHPHTISILTFPSKTIILIRFCTLIVRICIFVIKCSWGYSNAKSRTS